MAEAYYKTIDGHGWVNAKVLDGFFFKKKKIFLKNIYYIYTIINNIFIKNVNII